MSFPPPNNIIVFSLKNKGLSISAYPVPIVLLLTTTFFAFQTSRTGIPAIGLSGSSRADELTISLAPTTRTTSVSGKSSLIYSISKTISYGIPTSAKRTFICPGILPATGWIANLTLTPFYLNFDVRSAMAY